MSSSYNGWPASKDPKAIGVNPAFAIHGHRFPGGVKGGDVETVFSHLGEQLHARVEEVDADAVKDDWGWVYKASANSPDLLSCHSSATALDWNATRHPNRKRGTWTPAQRAEIRKILDEIVDDDGVPVLRWLALKDDGGSAKSTPDEMHFEIRGTPAQVAQAARRIRQTPTEEPDMQSDERQALFDIRYLLVTPYSEAITEIRGTVKNIAEAVDGAEPVEVDVDESKIAEIILRTLTPEAIASALADDQAKALAEELAKRLAS